MTRRKGAAVFGLMVSLLAGIAPGSGMESMAAPPVTEMATGPATEAAEGVDTEKGLMAVGEDGLLLSVFFEPGAGALTDAAVDALRELAQHWKDSGRTLIVRGVTGQTGSREVNLALGMRRALLVGKYLQQQGVRRIRIVSFGEELSEQGCVDDPARCRRVDILMP